MAVLGEEEETTNEMIRDFNLVCEEYGNRINKEKTKCMAVSYTHLDVYKRQIVL